ncbi:MAG: prepilin-type N-terminal cleavage/methylation domain-containing protein [Gammaproteobacteria bacterium]
MNHVKCRGGFTLIEVIISIFILSIMSVAALSSFKQMIHAKEVQKKHEIVLTSLSYAYTTLLNDVTQQVDLETPIAFTERDITFVRAWPGSDAEPDVATIEYTWGNDGLVRDVTRGENSTSQTLLKDVRSLQWQWLVDTTWNDISVPIPTNKTLRALKLTFIDPTLGEISWIFARP